MSEGAAGYSGEGDIAVHVDVGLDNRVIFCEGASKDHQSLINSVNTIGVDIGILGYLVCENDSGSTPRLLTPASPDMVVCIESIKRINLSTLNSSPQTPRDSKIPNESHSQFLRYWVKVFAKFF